MPELDEMTLNVHAKPLVLATLFRGSDLLPKFSGASVHFARKSYSKDGVKVPPASPFLRKATAREAELLAVL